MFLHTRIQFAQSPLTYWLPPAPRMAPAVLLLGHVAGHVPSVLLPYAGATSALRFVRGSVAPVCLLSFLLLVASPRLRRSGCHLSRCQGVGPSHTRPENPPDKDPEWGPRLPRPRAPPGLCLTRCTPLQQLAAWQCPHRLVCAKEGTAHSRLLRHRPASYPTCIPPRAPASQYQVSV